MSQLTHKLKKASQLFCCLMSKSYASRYYTEKLYTEVKNKGTGIKVKGKIIYTDKRQLVIGNNVSIGHSCYFQSEGGIYIEDGAVIGNSVSITTVPAGIVINDLTARELSLLKPVIIKKGAVVPDHAKLIPGTIVQGKNYSDEKSGSVNHFTLAENSFFVVSTGRSGTNAISRVLSQHPQINCEHEAHFVFNRLSTQLAHQFRTRAEVKQELEAILINCSTIHSTKQFIGECDLKNSNLIPLIAEILPKAKFIWLIRDARKFVASAYGRRWFDQYEYEFPKKELYSFDTSGKDPKLFDHWRMEYAIWRINGNYCGQFEEAEWLAMGCFERCCWYWNYWNETIESDLNKLSSERFFRIQLEKMEDQLSELLKFLSADNMKLENKHTNKAFHKVVEESVWSPEQTAHYNKWCRQSMEKWGLNG